MRARVIMAVLWSATAGSAPTADEQGPRPLVHVAVEVPLDFVSTPAGAAVKVDGAARCTRTPCRRLTATGEHEAVFLLDGFPPRPVPFRVPREGPVGVDFAAPAAPGEEGPPPAPDVPPVAPSRDGGPGPGPLPSPAASPPVSSPLPELTAHLARHWARLAFCHNVARAKDRSIPVRGGVVLEWTLSPAGRAEDVRVLEDGLKSPAVSACLVSQLRLLTFPRGRAEPVILRYPVHFPLLGAAAANGVVESRPAKR